MECPDVKIDPEILEIIKRGMIGACKDGEQLFHFLFGMDQKLPVRQELLNILTIKANMALMLGLPSLLLPKTHKSRSQFWSKGRKAQEPRPHRPQNIIGLF